MGNYSPSSQEEIREMLACVGCESVDGLYKDVPSAVYGKHIDIPDGMSELEVLEDIRATADKNVVYKSVFRGAGAYCHYIPAIVKNVISKEAFRTTYTPYQAEISQGNLQSIFEFQTMICELTGMDAANASVYDGASAAAEAVLMCQEKKKSKVIVSETIHPHTMEVIQTYCRSRHVEVAVIPEKEGTTDLDALKKELDDGTACIYFQQPNFYGLIEEAETIIEAAHLVKAKAIMGVQPVTLGVMKTPRELGADIAVGEAQPLGLPLSFGGPYIGFMTCLEKMVRKLPGRIVGATTDDKGNRCFVLTLQAREQHIRREKASSNVCSNQALCAMAVGAYLSAVGPDGLADVAKSCYEKAHYLAKKLGEIGFTRVHGKPFFNEFLTDCPSDPLEIERKLSEKGILAGLPIGNKMLWCVTEMNSRKQMDQLVDILKGGN